MPSSQNKVSTSKKRKKVNGSKSSRNFARIHGGSYKLSEAHKKSLKRNKIDKKSPVVDKSIA